MRAPGTANPEMPDIRAQTTGAGETYDLRVIRGLWGESHIRLVGRHLPAL